MVRHEPGELVSLVAVRGGYWRAVVCDNRTQQATEDFDRETIVREAHRAAMLVRLIRGRSGTLAVFHPPGFAKP